MKGRAFVYSRVYSCESMTDDDCRNVRAWINSAWVSGRLRSRCLSRFLILRICWSRRLNIIYTPSLSFLVSSGGVDFR